MSQKSPRMKRGHREELLEASRYSEILPPVIGVVTLITGLGVTVFPAETNKFLQQASQNLPVTSIFDYDNCAVPELWIVTAVWCGLLLLDTSSANLARKLFHIKPPDTHGPVSFLRAQRAQRNNLEQSLSFVPLLWLAGTPVGGNVPLLAAAVGIVWVAIRACYSQVYRGQVGEASPKHFQQIFNFTITSYMCQLVLFELVAYGLAKRTELLPPWACWVFAWALMNACVSLGFVHHDAMLSYYRLHDRRNCGGSVPVARDMTVPQPSPQKAAEIDTASVDAVLPLAVSAETVLRLLGSEEGAHGLLKAVFQDVGIGSGGFVCGLAAALTATGGARALALLTSLLLPVDLSNFLDLVASAARNGDVALVKDLAVCALEFCGAQPAGLLREDIFTFLQDILLTDRVYAADWAHHTPAFSNDAPTFFVLSLLSTIEKSAWRINSELVYFCCVLDRYASNSLAAGLLESPGKNAASAAGGGLAFRDSGIPLSVHVVLGSALFAALPSVLVSLTSSSGGGDGAGSERLLLTDTARVRRVEDLIGMGGDIVSRALRRDAAVSRDVSEQVIELCKSIARSLSDTSCCMGVPCPPSRLDPVFALLRSGESDKPGLLRSYLRRNAGSLGSVLATISAQEGPPAPRGVDHEGDFFLGSAGPAPHAPCATLRMLPQPYTVWRLRFFDSLLSISAQKALLLLRKRDLWGAVQDLAVDYADEDDPDVQDLVGCPCALLRESLSTDVRASVGATAEAIFDPLCRTGWDFDLLGFEKVGCEVPCDLDRWLGKDMARQFRLLRVAMVKFVWGPPDGLPRDTAPRFSICVLGVLGSVTSAGEERMSAVVVQSMPLTDLMALQIPGRASLTADEVCALHGKNKGQVEARLLEVYFLQEPPTASGEVRLGRPKGGGGKGGGQTAAVKKLPEPLIRSWAVPRDDSEALQLDYVKSAAERVQLALDTEEVGVDVEMLDDDGLEADVPDIDGGDSPRA